MRIEKRYLYLTDTEWRVLLLALRQHRTIRLRHLSEKIVL